MYVRKLQCDKDSVRKERSDGTENISFRFLRQVPEAFSFHSVCILTEVDSTC